MLGLLWWGVSLKVPVTIQEVQSEEQINEFEHAEQKFIVSQTGCYNKRYHGGN